MSDSYLPKLEPAQEGGCVMSNVIAFKPRTPTEEPERQDSPHQALWQSAADSLENARSLMDEIPLSAVMDQRTVAALAAINTLAGKVHELLWLVVPGGER